MGCHLILPSSNISTREKLVGESAVWRANSFVRERTRDVMVDTNIDCLPAG